jgi:hypothetical protein
MTRSAGTAGPAVRQGRKAASHGRPPEDVKFFQSLHVVTGGTVHSIKDFDIERTRGSAFSEKPP